MERTQARSLQRVLEHGNERPLRFQLMGRHGQDLAAQHPPIDTHPPHPLLHILDPLLPTLTLNPLRRIIRLSSPYLRPPHPRLSIKPPHTLNTDTRSQEGPAIRPRHPSSPSIPSLRSPHPRLEQIPRHHHRHRRRRPPNPHLRHPRPALRPPHHPLRPRICRPKTRLVPAPPRPPPLRLLRHDVSRLAGRL